MDGNTFNQDGAIRSVAPSTALPESPARVPHALERRPWFSCNQGSPDFGSVFVRTYSDGARAVFFDRKERLHAMTYGVHHEPIGDEIELHGRRFTVQHLSDGRAA